MLLVAALSMAEMSVVFPIGMGVALVIGLVLNFLGNEDANRIFLLAGAALVIVAVVLASMAFSEHSTAKLLEAMRAGKTKSTKKVISWKAVILCFFGGIVLGSFFPLIVLGQTGENGLGPYSIGWVFAMGVLVSTFVFNLFFMNLPVQGRAIDMTDFFKARFSLHLKGLIGGILMYVAVIAAFVAARAEGAAHVQPFISYGLGQIGIVIAALWGILRWKEFADASPKVKSELGFMLVLLVVGIGLASGGMIAIKQ